MISEIATVRMITSSGSALLSLVILLLGFVGGCGDSQIRQPLEGTVTFQGELLPEGSIRFESADSRNSAFSTGAVIKDGVYDIPIKFGLPPGSYLVRINSASAPFLPPGTPPGSPRLPETKELIPAAYNEKSNEKIEVKQGGENKFDFIIE